MKKHLYTVTRGTCWTLSLAALLAGAPEALAIMPPNTSAQTPAYNDGTYTATGEYGGLPSHLTVTVVLKAGTIAHVAVKTHATDPTSLDYQRAFAAAVPKVVQGKHLGAVKVGKLAGASGCPIGFNDALTQIKKQAAKS